MPDQDRAGKKREAITWMVITSRGGVLLGKLDILKI